MKSKDIVNNQSDILLVEDSPTQLQQLQHFLETHDYNVITAVNGKLALEAARMHPPAIIISDIVMPEMNGFELCKAIRSDEILKNTPIVLLTSLSGAADVIEALKSGADNFIRKPYDEQNLLLRIKNILMSKKFRLGNKFEFGVEISLGGVRHFITAERQQILDLLISTYEQAVELCGTLQIRDKQISRSNEILRGIYLIAKGLNGSMTRQEAIAQVLDRAMLLPDVRAGWFSVYEGESNFKLVGSRGLPPALEVPGALNGDCLCRRKVLAGEINRSMNIAECDRLKNAKGDTRGLRSHVTIPLKSGNVLMGILNLVGAENVLFDDNDLDVLNGIGNQIGAALDRCLIHEHLEELVIERTADLSSEIIERKKAEQNVKKLNRLYAVLSNINQAIVRIRDIHELYNESCRIAVEEGSFRMAWIGLLDRNSNKVRVVASAGIIDDYLDKIDIDLNNKTKNHGPSGSAIKLGAHCISSDIANDANMLPWREDALRLGYRSSASFPLKVFGGVQGVFTLYSNELNSFNDVEIKLLDELAMDISFASEVAEKEQKRLQGEVDLIRAKELAEKSNKLKDAFISNISHEIRTPLNGILGMTSLIKESLAQYVSKDEVDYFNAIDSSSKRIVRTTDMILNFSRLQVGEFSVSKKLLKLPAIINNLMTEYKSTADINSLEFTFENKCGDGSILADSYCISHAISNLIDNALKYTQKGFVKVTLYKDVNGTLILDVKDSGIGIEEKYLKHLFEPYTQEEIGYSRPYEGIGLGLSLVKKFLDLNSSSISVVSKKGEGTTFTIHFSHATNSIFEKDIKKEQKPSSVKITRTLHHSEDIKPLILIVEDNEINQNSLRLLLSKKYNSVIVPSASQALEALKINHIDLILMDISIQGDMNGLELTTLIKKTREYSHIPVIAVTAHAFLADRQNSFDAGCNEYISKPYELKELFEKINKLLSINF